MNDKNTDKAVKSEDSNNDKGVADNGTVKVLAQHKALKDELSALRNDKTIKESVKGHAITSMEIDLANLENKMGNALDMERLARLIDVCKGIQGFDLETGKEDPNKSLIDIKTAYIVEFDPDLDGEFKFTVEPAKGARAKRAKGEKGSKSKSAWSIAGFGMSDNGKNLLPEGREILLKVSDSTILVCGEEKPVDLKGIASRLGWKMHPNCGPVQNWNQGRKSKDDDGTVRHYPRWDGIEDVSGARKGTLNAHKRALIAESKVSKSKHVKDAVTYLSDLLRDSMVEDGVMEKGQDKPIKRDNLIKYVRTLNKIADQCHAEVIG